MVKYRSTFAPWLRYGSAIIFTLVALALTAFFWDFVRDSPFLFFFASVALSSWYGGITASLLAVLLAVAAADFLLIAGDPGSTDTSNLVRLLLFIFVSLLITWIETRRQRLERALREAHDELNVILNGVSDGIVAYDATGKIVFSNRAAAKLQGYSSSAELMAARAAKAPRQYAIEYEDGLDMPTTMMTHDVFSKKQRITRSYQMSFKETDQSRRIRQTSLPVFDEHGNVKLAVSIIRDVTEQANVQRELAEFAAIVQNSDDGIIGKTLDHTVASWNPAAERLYGYTAEEAIGRHISFLFPEDVKAKEEALHEQVQRGEHIQHYETVRLAKDGTRLDVSLTISPIRDAEGNTTGYSSIDRDISERSKFDKIREENAFFLRKVLDSLPILVGVINLKGILTEANETALSLGDLAPEDVIGKRFEDAYWWSHSTEVQQALIASLEKAKAGQTTRYDVEIRVGDKQFTTIDFMISPMYDSDGNLTHLIPAAIDISERKKREQEILQLTMLTESQRRRLDNIIANVPGIVYETSAGEEPTGRQVDFVSNYAEKMLAYPMKEWRAVSNFWEQVIHPEDWERVLEEAAEFYERAESGVIQFRCIRQDGQVLFTESHVTVVRENDQQIRTYGIVMDITERKQFEQELAQYAEELRRSNEELEQFAYVASHDLQEPLRMVTSYLQLIEQRYIEQLDETAIEFINFAVDGAGRMKTLINDLLAYSRVQRSKKAFQPVKLETIIEQVLESLQLSIEDSQAIVTYDKLPDVTANEQQMIQLFQNLIGNALKFHSDAPPQIHIGVKRHRNDWEFCVSDNGIGIEQEYLDRIFVIFQRLHARDEYPGTGIGLAICKKIVDKHGGKIWVESVPGEGTTFYFTLPVNRRRSQIYGSN